MANPFGWIFDLVLLLVAAGLAAATVVLGLGGWIRALIVVPLVVFVPGYALMAALFPAAPERESRSFDANRSGLTDPRSEKGGIDGVERVGFSAVTSIVVVALVALAVHFSPWPITVGPVLVGLVGVVVAFTALAFVRRATLRDARRYSPAVLAPLASLPFDRATDRMGDGRPWAFNVALAVAVLLLATSVGYAAINPPRGDGFTELSVDTPNVTGDTEALYPETFAAGSSRQLPLLLSNHEHEAVDYEVIVLVQRIERDDAGVSVVEESEAARRTVSLGAGETRNVSVDVGPTMAGDDLRLAVLAYVGDPPGDPGVESARQSLTLPIDVVGGNDGSAAVAPPDATTLDPPAVTRGA